jgi:hypothetical protein
MKIMKVLAKSKDNQLLELTTISKDVEEAFSNFDLFLIKKGWEHYLYVIYRVLNNDGEVLY